MIRVGHTEDLPSHHSSLFFEIALLHPIVFLWEDEGDYNTKTNHPGEIPTPLRDRSLFSKPGKRDGLTSFCASAQPQWTYVNSLTTELQAVPSRAVFLLFPFLISFDQKFCLDQENFSHEVPTKSISFNEKAFIRSGGKGLLLKDSRPIPIVSTATGTWLQNTI